MRQNVVSLQNPCRCQIVDDVLQTHKLENGAKRGAILRVQKGLLLTQVCRRKME